MPPLAGTNVDFVAALKLLLPCKPCRRILTAVHITHTARLWAMRLHTVILAGILPLLYPFAPPRLVVVQEWTW